MHVELHNDTMQMVQKEAEYLGITFEEAANFLIRFGTTHKAGPAEMELLICDHAGTRFYDYSSSIKGNPVPRTYSEI